MRAATQIDTHQLELARLRSRRSWRVAVLGCLLLAVTVVLSPLIPAVIAVTVIENGIRENAAASGAYTQAHQRRRAVCWSAGLALVCGSWLVFWNSDGHALGGLLVGVLLVGAGLVALTAVLRRPIH